MKENKKCPSYDNGTCESAPMPYSVKCSDMKDCVWHNLEKFNKGYEDILERMGKLKAYVVTDKWGDSGNIIVWAVSAAQAKAKSLYKDELDGVEYIDIRVKRIKAFDKYQNTKKVPIEELLQMGWWFYCGGFCSEEINQDNIDSKKAFIVKGDKDFNDWVEGDVYCEACYEKLKERGLICG